MILHLILKTEWDALPAGQPYRTKSLDTEGFIHCTSGDALMLDVANTFYKDQSGDFLALEIDESKLTSTVKWEAPAPLSGGAEEQGSTGATRPPEVTAEFGDTADTSISLPPSTTASLFPHIYGPINHDAIVGMRAITRAGDGTFTGYAPVTQPSVSDPSNPLNIKSPSQMAQELLDATDEFSESLKRFKDSVEGRMAEIDDKIKKL